MWHVTDILNYNYIFLLNMAFCKKTNVMKTKTYEPILRVLKHYYYIKISKKKILPVLFNFF